MLLHEQDPARGGAPLETLPNDCAVAKRERVFAPWREVIAWHRIKEFQARPPAAAAASH